MGMHIDSHDSPSDSVKTCVTAQNRERSGRTIQLSSALTRAQLLELRNRLSRGPSAAAFGSARTILSRTSHTCPAVDYRCSLLFHRRPKIHLPLRRLINFFGQEEDRDSRFHGSAG